MIGMGLGFLVLGGVLLAIGILVLASGGG